MTSSPAYEKNLTNGKSVRRNKARNTAIAMEMWVGINCRILHSRWSIGCCKNEWRHRWVMMMTWVDALRKGSQSKCKRLHFREVSERRKPTNKPARNQLHSNQLVRNQSVRNQLVSNQLVRNQPVSNQLHSNQPVRNQSVRNQSVRNQPVRNQLHSNQLAS